MVLMLAGGGGGGRPLCLTNDVDMVVPVYVFVLAGWVDEER
jgi:hypothetical protein